ncbi:hypothetical protein ACEUZ9_000960 [Paracoccus litorisediminis]|uniref:hypothetical protein n=1 Tax=Paracoccus litorisediminis TaxID=2006130 RepID=UPI0037315D79
MDPQTVGMVAVACFLAVGVLIALFSKPDPLMDTYRGEVDTLEGLSRNHGLRPGRYHVALIRQSGNLYRELGTFPSPDEAVRQAVLSFRRAKFDDVRITHRTDGEIAVYRRIYNFRGRAEGKKLAGARIVCLDSPAPQTVSAASKKPAVASPIPKPKPNPSVHMPTLTVFLKGIEGDASRDFNVSIAFRCNRCGGRQVSYESEEAQSEVTCKACGVRHGTYGDFRALTESTAQGALALRGHTGTMKSFTVGTRGDQPLE